jgi:glucokinase
VKTPDVDNPEEALLVYVESIRELLNALPDGTEGVSGVGFGMPGHINPDLLSSTWNNVPILDDFPLVPFVSDQLRLPVRLDNDATAAALAEYHFGGGREAKRMLLVTVGTGIGLGLIIDGKAQRPTRGCMGDPGHIIVDPLGRWQCKLGCRGCLETVGTSLALEREAVARAQWNPESTMGKRLVLDNGLGTRQIIEMAISGDCDARDLISQMGTWLGIAATSWCHIYDPDCILLGGGVSAAADLLLVPLRETLRKTGMRTYVDGVSVGLAKLGNDAGMIGSASLILFDEQIQR